MDDKKLDKLVLDLVRLGDYSNWVEPKQPENIDWFIKKGSIKLYTDGKIASERLEELAKAGADMTNKAYIIGNVNCTELLEVALKYGADPNMPGKTGILPFDRAMYRGRTKIASLLVNHPNFDFSKYDINPLLSSLENGRYKLAMDIVDINPKLMIEEDKHGNNAMIAISKYLSTHKINSKAITFIKKCLDYADTHNVLFGVNKVNKSNQSISSLSIEVATLITEHYALCLNKELTQKENKNNSSVKFKI